MEHQVHGLVLNAIRNKLQVRPHPISSIFLNLRKMLFPHGYPISISPPHLSVLPDDPYHLTTHMR